MDIELSVVLELLLNLSLLVALSIISGFIDQRAPRDTLRGKLYQGALFSGVAVVGMLHPFILRPGVIFDGRSMLVALCALFFGPLSTAMTVLILCALRIGLGGGGLVMGVLVITASGVIGLAARSRFDIDVRSPTTMQLLLLGLVVHVVMLLLMFTLPGDAAWQAIQRLGIPIMVMFPLATVLTGKILADQLEARRVLTRLRESEEKYRVLVEDSPDPIISVDSSGVFKYANAAFSDVIGVPTQELVGRSMRDVFPEEDAERRFGIVAEVFQDGEQSEYEVCFPGEDHDRYFVTTITPLRDEGGAVVSAICSSKEITDRKRAEAEAEAKSEELERYFSTALDLFCIADTDGHFLRLNQQWERVLGYTIEELEGALFMDYVHPDDVEPTEQAMSTLGRQEPILSFSNRYRCKDGSFRWIEWRSYPEGERIFAAARDITESREAQQALIESESRFRLFADLAPVGIGITNQKEEILYLSPTFERLFGYTCQDIPTIEDWRKCAYPDDAVRDRARTAWAAMLEASGNESKEHQLVELPMVCKDGMTRHVDVRLGRTSDLNVIVFTDISERKRAEEEQAQSLALLENLARLVPGVIYQYKLNPDGSSCFPWSSVGIRMIYEVTPEEVREDASPVFGRLHPEDVDRVSEQIFESARTLEHFQCEYRVVLPEQGLRWRWSQARPERTDDGGTLWHGIIIDVTERKHAELENERLEAQLQQAMKMEAIGRLAGGVAHDFNNLLTGIQGFAELIHESMSDSDPAKQDVEEIQKASDSAASLTAQLLAFSRKQIVSPELIDINEAVAQSEKMLKRIIGEDIEFVFEPGEDIGKIRVDPGQVNQVFVNLAVNSRDAMPEGGKLVLRTRSDALDGLSCQTCGEPIQGEHVILEISDNGSGIPSETLKKIFEPFFTTKGQGKGTGLGLSTVHGIVHQNKGHIDVDSQLGEGATFRIYLPEIAETEEGRFTKTAPENLRGQERILVVEDQDLVLKLAVRALSIQGYHVTEARGGEAALELCERAEQPFDLVLTDVVMPKMSGKELFQRLTESYPGMKVLFMSGYTEDTIAHHGVLDRGINFIQKPFRPQELARTVRAVLNGEEAG